MKEFSAGDAIASGFRLIGREPLAFLAWAVVYGVVGIGPQFLGMSMSVNALSGVGSTTGPSALAAQMAPLQALQPLSILAALLSSVLLYGAVFRAMLAPQDRRFLYLRLGMAEFWLGLSFLVLMVGMIIAIFAMIIPMALVIGIGSVAGTGGGIVSALLSIPLSFGVFGVLVWLAIRFSLAMPMSFAQKNLRIPESWRLTKGHAWPMFGVLAALALILLVVEGVIFGVVIGLMGSMGSMAELSQQFSRNPAAMFAKVNPLIWVGAVAVWALFGAAVATIFAAPLAHIYAALKGPDTAEVFS